MFDWTVCNLTTGEEKTTQGTTFRGAMLNALQMYPGTPARNIKVYPAVTMDSEKDCSVLTAVQIAKTTFRRITSIQDTPTNRAILADLDRLTGKYNNSPEKQTDPRTVSAFFAGAGAVLTDEKGQIVSRGIIGQDTQDVIMWAYVGVRQGTLLYAMGDCDTFAVVNMGFSSLNDYLTGERKVKTHEVFTLYDLDTDTSGEETYTPVKTEIRRILRGLTEKETQEKQTVRDTPLAQSMQEISQTLSPRQLDVWDILSNPRGRRADGYIENNRTGGKQSAYRGIYSVCKVLGIDKKTVKEHVSKIAEKVLKNDTARAVLRKKGYRTDTRGAFGELSTQGELLEYIMQGVCDTLHEEMDSRPGRNDRIIYRAIRRQEQEKQTRRDMWRAILTPAPALCPVHSVTKLPPLHKKYLLTPYAEYRQTRQDMYNMLFGLTDSELQTRRQYAEKHARKHSKNRLHRGMWGKMYTAPAPVSIIRHTAPTELYTDRAGRQFALDCVFCARPLSIMTPARDVQLRTKYAIEYARDRQTRQDMYNRLFGAD